MHACTHEKQPSQCPLPATGFLLSEDGVFEVEVRLGSVRDEELTAVRIGSVVGHGYHPTYFVLSVAGGSALYNIVNGSANSAGGIQQIA